MSTQLDRFVRIPTDLLETLLHIRLSGLQWRILMWVVRQTYGWNRSQTRFTWYRMAQDLGSDRGAVFRAGTQLLKIGVVVDGDGHLRVQATVAKEQLGITQDSAATQQRPLPGSNGSVARRQRFSAEPKTVVKTIDKRRRGCGHCGYLSGPGKNPAPLQQLMDYYVALRGTTLSDHEKVTSYRRFRKSATALLEAYDQNVKEAQDAIARIVRTQTEHGSVLKRTQCN